MRQSTGYAYGGEEDCVISYKCEGCGQRVRVTAAQAQYFHGPFTACSRVCILKAHAIRAQRERLDMGVPGPSQGAARARAPGVEDGTAQER